MLQTHEDAIAKAILADLADPAFEKFCAETGRTHWTLALSKAKIPERPELEEAMRRLMGELPRRIAASQPWNVAAYSEAAGQYVEMGQLVEAIGDRTRGRRSGGYGLQYLMKRP